MAASGFETRVTPFIKRRPAVFQLNGLGDEMLERGRRVAC